MRRTRKAQAPEPPEVDEAEAAVDAGAELLSEVSQKATFPMRFGEEAEEFSFEVPDLVSLRSKAKELKVVTGRLAAKKEDCITGLNSKIMEWRLLARAKVALADRDVNSTDYETDPEDASKDMHEDDLDEDDEADALASSIERRGQLLFALPVGSRESEMATAGKFLKYGRAMPARKKHLAKLASSEDKKVQWAYLLFKILEAKVPDSELGRFIVSKRARVRSFRVRRADRACPSSSTNLRAGGEYCNDR